jgi:protein phosphatase
MDLCDEVIKVFAKEPALLKLRSPIKIFGNTHGQLGDLMKIFEHFGAPCDIMYKGDIDGFGYLFLGDYVDFGKFNIELVCLLFALKLKYPDQIYMLRGHHEDRKVNRIFGFAEECVSKMGDDLEDIENSVFHKINNVFDHLPLAAVVEDQIFCVHGGIGQTLRRIEEILNLEKPIDINHDPASNNDKIILDLLWSDPVMNETDLQDMPNPSRDIFQKGYIIKYGIQRTRKFLAENNLRMIIRSHEPVGDGYEKIGNEIVTIFSTMDYQGRNKNASCCIIIKKNSEIIPKVIFPTSNNGGVEGANSFEKWAIFSQPDELMGSYEMLGKGGQKGLNINNVWFDDEEIKIKQRPQTPNRTRGNGKKI